MSYNYVDWDMPSLKTPSERVIYTLQWHCLSGGLLFTMIAVCTLEVTLYNSMTADTDNQFHDRMWPMKDPLKLGTHWIQRTRETPKYSTESSVTPWNSSSSSSRWHWSCQHTFILVKWRAFPSWSWHGFLEDWHFNTGMIQLWSMKMTFHQCCGCYRYIVSPLYRSPGMAMTMLANLLSLIGVFYHVYTQGPMVMAIIMSFFVLKTFYNFLANFLKTPFFL